MRERQQMVRYSCGLVCGALLAMPALSWASPAYTVSRIDLDGAEGLWPMTIGDGGDVSLSLYAQTGPEVPASRLAFSYGHGAVSQIVGPAGFMFLGVTVNGSGQMAGSVIPSSFDIPAQPTAAAYRDGVVSVLPAPPGLAPGYTSVDGMNDRGDMVGWWQDDKGGAEAILWTADGQVIRLDAGRSGISFAYAINERGTVAGWVTSPEGVTDIVVWRDGTMTRIDGVPGIGGLPRLNDRDQVLVSAWGQDDDGRRLGRSYIWDDGQLTEVPGLANQGRLDVAGWNEAGLAVANYGGEDRPQVFRDGVLEDLNSLIAVDSGWVLQQVRGINNDGQIVGLGLYDGEYAAFLLTPVPEPVGGVLVGGVVVALMMRRRRWG